ncbi:Immunoglobulin I-set domain containing protein [Aphelenchoides avenae]|nr:Immunoglobulin I-set domain containing protein [Aphelenchus avenae]
MGIGPFFEKPPSILNRPDGSVLFECMCNANPEPTVEWFHKDKKLSGDKYVFKVKKQVGKYMCTMIVKNPTQADQGHLQSGSD